MRDIRYNIIHNKYRADVCLAFQVIGLDYLILTAYKKSRKTEIINYVLLYSCSLTRAVYFELMHDLSLVNLKGITARCSRPEEIFSNNFSTVQAPSKWIRQTMNDIVPSWMCYRVLNTPLVSDYKAVFTFRLECLQACFHLAVTKECFLQICRRI